MAPEDAVGARALGLSPPIGEPVVATMKFLRLLTCTGVVWTLGCASSGARVETDGTARPDTVRTAPATDETARPSPPPPGSMRRYRFRMEQPANDDFAFKDADVFIYIRPYENYLSMKVQGREQSRVKIHWSDSEFADILGRSYLLVPPSVSVEQAAYGIVAPTDVEPDGLFTGRVLLLDPAHIQTIRALGGSSFPVVPEDAGPPEEIRGREFTLRLVVEVNYVRRAIDFIFSIEDIIYN